MSFSIKVYFLVFLLLSCQKSDFSLGLVAGLSGPNSELGVAGRNGAQLAVEEINAQGGILGRKLILREMDDKSDPVQVAAALDTLASEGIKLIIGPYISSITQSAVETAGRHDLFLLSPTVSSPLFNRLDDHLFRMTPSVVEEVYALTKYLMVNTNIRNVSFLLDGKNSAYSIPILEAFKKTWEFEGYRVINEVKIDSGSEIDWKSVEAELLEKNPDAVYLITSGAVSALAAQQLRVRGYKGAFILSGWTATGDFITLGNGSFEGAYLAQFFSFFSDDPALSVFRDNYRERFGSEPSFSSVYSYDAVRLFRKILELEPDYQGFNSVKSKFLQLDSVPLLKGRLVFDEWGDVKGDVSVFQVRESTLVRIDE